MPRSKFTKPPGPFPPFEQIQLSKFLLSDDQWRNLTELLPPKLAALSVPSDAAAKLPTKIKTIADVVIRITENEINRYLAGSPLVSQGGINPANVRAAIRRLREALKPFVGGWVDYETAKIVSANLDAKLAAREGKISKLRLAPAHRRALAMLCQRIVVFVKSFVSANDETISEEDMLRYVDAALTFARIKHPNISKHRDRLVRLCFPKDRSTQRVKNVPLSETDHVNTSEPSCTRMVKMHTSPANPEFPLVVSPSKAMAMLDCGRTRLYQLLNAKELESYRDGKSRKITVASIQARIYRLLQQSEAA
jgi:hypothetical protein